jgi:hypothetical protein
LSCRSCNVFKSNFLFGIDENGFESERLFNPREDIWVEHFKVDLKTFEIIGTTKIGFGTINRLKINSKIQLSARNQWYKLDLFP